MERIADHPDIAAARRTGYPSWMDADWEEVEEEEIEDDY